MGVNNRLRQGIFLGMGDCMGGGNFHNVANVKHYFELLQCGDRLESLESDVCRRQILTSKVDHHTVRVKIVILIVEPYLP